MSPPERPEVAPFKSPFAADTVPIRVVHRVVPAAAPTDEKLFEPEGTAGGCASGECLPVAAPPPPTSSFALDRWEKAVEAVSQVSARHGKSLSFGRLLGIQNGEVELHFPPAAAFHRATATGAARPVIEKALTDFFKVPTRLKVVDKAPETVAPSLGEREAQSRASREKGIEDKLRAHPAVSAILKAIGGEIEHVQVLDSEPAVLPDEPNVSVEDK